MKRFLFALLFLASAPAWAQTSQVRIVGKTSEGVDRPVLVTPDGKLEVSSGAGGGAADSTAANQATQITAAQLTNTRLGDITSPAAGSVNARLAALLTALGTPLQSGGSIGNTVFGATQSGTWNITSITNPVAVTGTFWQTTQPISGSLTNINGTISLPTGAATSAAQTTGNSSLSSIDSKLTTQAGYLDGLEALLAAATPAGENHLGAVGGTILPATATPTVSASPAYSAGDVVGTKMTFANLARVTGGTGRLDKVSIFSKSAQTAALDFVLFHSDPSSSTFTDNAAFSLNAADFDKISCVVHVTDWTNLGTPSFAEYLGAACAYKISSGQTDGYGVLIARAALTLGSTSDLKVALLSIAD